MGRDGAQWNWIHLGLAESHPCNIMILGHYQKACKFLPWRHLDSVPSQMNDSGWHWWTSHFFSVRCILSTPKEYIIISARSFYFRKSNSNSVVFNAGWSFSLHSNSLSWHDLLHFIDEETEAQKMKWCVQGIDFISIQDYNISCLITSVCFSNMWHYNIQLNKKERVCLLADRILL